MTPGTPPPDAPCRAGAAMSDVSRHEALIGELCAASPAVRRLSPPWRRTLGWLAAVAVLGLALSQVSDLAAMEQRLLGAPDMALAMSGSALTAVLAALAAFQTSVPGRSRRWPLLPLPGVALWLGASGAGCLRAWAAPASHDPSLYEERVCLAFIVAVSVPLSLLLVAMLRRALPLRPGLTAGLGGLAAAAASATLLNLFHPYDAALSDIVVHALAVGIVVAVSRTVGGRRLR